MFFHHFSNSVYLHFPVVVNLFHHLTSIDISLLEIIIIMDLAFAKAEYLPSL
ncbi:hypothetical protein [uncultured Nonlabens sp.]|uniref:hypothetical protein n=1 Tax=uncultured Nonlabens sp. TaxID=859306 RepID=UPI0026221FC1|nr:hypothetical protein [uncultured Nonlabens sp.]